MLLGVLLMALVGCASAQERKVSDHFDGKRFFNPTLVGKFQPGFFDVLKIMSESRAKWPDKVENQGTPRLNEELAQDDIAITFVNHATFLIQTPELNILTDPIWSERASPVSWAGPKRVRPPGVKFEELPKIDLVVISHNHYDHLDVETLKRLNERFAPKVLVPIGDKELVESIGIKDVTELDWWDSIEISPDVQITFAPTQHWSSRGLFDKYKSLWGSYFIQLGNRSVYFGGDSGYSSHYVEIKKRLGSPEIALLGIGAYAPRWFMQPMHMNPAEAVQAHQDLGAKLSIGMHFGTFQMSAEAIDQPKIDLKEALKEANLSPEIFITLNEGETRIFKAKQRDEAIPKQRRAAKD